MILQRRVNALFAIGLVVILMTGCAGFWSNLPQGMKDAVYARAITETLLKVEANNPGKIIPVAGDVLSVLGSVLEGLNEDTITASNIDFDYIFIKVEKNAQLGGVESQILEYFKFAVVIAAEAIEVPLGDSGAYLRTLKRVVKVAGDNLRGPVVTILCRDMA